MSHSPPTVSEAIAPLAALPIIKVGMADYYRELTKSDDEYIRVSGYSGLLAIKAVRPDEYESVLALCHYGSVRRRAVELFSARFERELAERAARVEVDCDDVLQRRKLAAKITQDHAVIAEVEGAVFLHTALMTTISKAAEAAELAGGWQGALPWFLRQAVTFPLEQAPCGGLLNLLSNGNQWDLLDEAIGYYREAGLHPANLAIFAAKRELARGDAQEALALLEPHNSVLANVANISGMAINFLQVKAETLDKLGDFHGAYDAYVALNNGERSAKYDADYFVHGIAQRAAVPVPVLPPAPHPNVVMMCGFPRSGTTLLENILAAHPLVETFEEVPAMHASFSHVERAWADSIDTQSGSAREVFNGARETYYGYFDRYRLKPEAQVIVDKLPLRSSEAAFIKKLMPDMRFVFSIRHPFDVILSCFKQRFAPNPAMENFHSIADASRLYALVMEHWFSVHGMDDPDVHYVRYHELVTDFERVARGTFDFLGVGWDESVQRFAEKSNQRSTRTPSYQKVRQGLTIGVQSSWRNYEFIFRSEAARPLLPWVRFFGYEGFEA